MRPYWRSFKNHAQPDIAVSVGSLIHRLGAL